MLASYKRKESYGDITVFVFFLPFYTGEAGHKSLYYKILSVRLDHLKSTSPEEPLCVAEDAVLTTLWTVVHKSYNVQQILPTRMCILDSSFQQLV